MSFAKVILRGAIRQTDRIYTYSVPDNLADKIRTGCLVKVPFGAGNKVRSGIVCDIVEDSDQGSGFKIKSIMELADESPVMTEEQISLIDPLSRRFNCTKGDIVELFVPAFVEGHKVKLTDYLEVSDKETAENLLNSNAFRSVNHIKALEYLLVNGKTEKKLLCTDTGIPPASLDGLRKRGLISLSKGRASEGTAGSISQVPVKGADKYSQEFDLNQEQRKAIDRIDSVSGFKVFLLYGITGSGKTEVFLNCASSCIAAGGQVLYLVPEIALTPQTVAWIKGRLGSQCAVLHSKLTDKQRFDQWDMIRRGTARVIVGPRSAVFAPFTDLKLVIIDEEHDSSYKAESHPHYNAKTVAMMRAKLSGARVVMGSATPAVESFYAATQGYYELLRLPSRANRNAVLPKVHSVDMKQQLVVGGGDLLSIPLRNAMARAFADHKQVILFLNRRGYSRTLVCNTCGETVKCVNCSVGMTLHNNPRSSEKLLICHYCGYTIPADSAECLSCGGKKFTRAGFGTQQLEETLCKLYPNERILRMDQDTTAARGAVSDIVSKFSNGEASILIGTQMIAKGHDFPNCTVVGILSADLMINSANVHGSERAFALITQAAGRAGRGSDPGEVYIQTYNPDDPLFKNAVTQNYEEFYSTEIQFRKDLDLPPFKAMGEIILSLPDDKLAYERSCALMKYINDFLAIQDKSYGFESFGPIPDVIYELRGKYRYSITIKAKNISAINAVFRQIMEDFDPKLYPLSFDV
ncbi:MAG: primosomal protein N' [Clostridiales bacterium]|nr:primosomal protein N' [Clostridiales bacterium]